MNIDIKKIIDLRMRLHRLPELSEKEFKTSEEIEKFVKKYDPDKIIKLANTGIAVVFDSKKAGLVSMFRAELDAVEIDEPKEIQNHSVIENVSHKCGHDGHMAILTGLAEAISKDRPETGKTILLFQPAEENVKGAKNILNSPEFEEIKPDYIFALHNLPNFPLNSVVIKQGIFSAATIGLTIKLTGKPAHAAYPENAINPENAVISILDFVKNDIPKKSFFSDVLITPVFVQLGTPNFGITPGSAEVRLTLRAFDNGDLKKLLEITEQEIDKIAYQNNLKFRIKYADESPAIENNKNALDTVIESAIENNFQIVEQAKPFRWAEDFGFFTQKFKGAFFGFGIGESPELHDIMYDFNDNAILPAIKLFYSIYLKTNK